MIIQADARSIPLRDGSVNCCVTSPPYWGLRDYGVPGQLGLEPSPEEYVAGMVAVFREVRRVLRDDGTLWLNLGDCYATGAGKVGDCPGGGEQGDRWTGRTARRSGHEGKQSYANQVGPLTQPNRLPIAGLKPKDLVGIPWRVAFALQADGWYLRSDIIWSKPNPMPESVTDRPTKAHEYLFLLAKSESYYCDMESIKEPAIHAGRVLDYTGDQKNNTTDDKMQATRPKGRKITVADGRNRRTVWTVATQPYSGAHFATFPEKLIEPCVLAGAPKGGIVFDPFGGSGTTVRVARRLQRRGVAIELNPDYIALAKKRIAGVQMELVA